MDSQVHGRRKMWHLKMDKRQNTDTLPPQIFSSSIIQNPANTNTDTGIPIATGAPTSLITASFGGTPLTTVTNIFQETSTLANGQTTLVTATRQITVTDAAQYSSILATQHTSQAGTTSSPTPTSSSAAKHTSGLPLSTLIPVIVAPVAAVLVITFVLFWFFMRRRHHREAEKQEFVMASKKEKAPSRGNSTNSSSSTRELVRPEKIDKGPGTSSFENPRPSIELFPPTVPSSEIGVARPMTPPDKGMTKGGPQVRSPLSKPAPPAVPNFSGLRPGPPPGQGAQRDQFGASGPRSRSNSNPRGPPNRPPNAPPLGRPGPFDTRGPAPGPRPGPAPGPMPRQNGPSPRTQDPRRSPSGSIQAPSPVAGTGMKTGNRAAPPRALDPPTPTGAFNGASPISQYSPIVKEAPSLGAMLAEDPPRTRGPSPPALQTTNLGPKRVDSPVDDNILSMENMRIARLANSSRLGFNSPTEAKSPIYPSHTKTLSPELPTPLSRGDLAPQPAAPPKPSIPDTTFGATNNVSRGPSRKSSRGRKRQTDRVSVVSRVSTDDGYVDMEFDDKSDVSSLDEREKWELETKLSHIGSSTHLPPSAQAEQGNTNYRDRDSEGPFVLSRY